MKKYSLSSFFGGFLNINFLPSITTRRLMVLIARVSSLCFLVVYGWVSSVNGQHSHRHLRQSLNRALPYSNELDAEAGLVQARGRELNDRSWLAAFINSVADAVVEANTEEEEPDDIIGYSELSWEELPTDVKLAAEALGYTQEAWDNTLPVDTDYLTWDQLTDAQKEAAGLFGYDQVAWDTTSSLNNTDTVDYESFFWDDLPTDVQEAARLLGYNKILWDNGMSVSTDILSWSQLTDEQKEAAALFGYDQNKWDSGV